MIRIGLGSLPREVRISSPAAFYLVEKIPEAPRQLIRGDVQVRIEHDVEETTEKYRVQVGSFANPEAAEALRAELAAKFEAPVAVLENPTTKTSQVRIGLFASREAAQAFISQTLTPSGYRDSFIVREQVASGGGETKLALHGPDGLFRISKAGFIFSPATPTDFLRFDGKPYRGVFDLFLSKDGKIAVVNQVGMEEYLFGVVPAELSPTQFPEPAALEAQAVAARTYALKNMGRFRSEGFDLTSDIRTQVYTGVNGEKEASNDAVQRTAGVAIYYQNKLIDAMYMSTCGGKTEDFAGVFDAAPVPYLKSVFCTVEEESGNTSNHNLAGSHLLDETLYADDGRVANRDLELASILGLVDNPHPSTEYLTAPPTKAEIRQWVELARKRSQKGSAGAAPADNDFLTRAGFLRYAAEAFFGKQNINSRISPSDAGYYMSNLKDGNAVPQEARKSIAYIMQSGAWRPYPDNSIRPGEPIRRVDILALLARWLETSQPDILRSGSFAGFSGLSTNDTAPSTITIKWGTRTQQFPLSKELRLFRLAGEQSMPADNLNIIGSEKVAFHLGSQGIIDFMEVELNPGGASSDRFSPVATWDFVITRANAGEKLRALAGNVGEVQDLRPSRIGSSGRAIQMQIVGSRGSKLVNGYSFRNALGLRDTLFTITRTHNPDGSIAGFVFHGRGWGHGVGLCQVGAFGMARAGKSFEEILKAYYTDVEIKKAY